MLISTLVLILLPFAAFGDIWDGWDGPGNRIILPGPIKRINQGLIRGRIELFDGLHIWVTYKGIPYAQPPVGEYRWRAPRPAEGWTGIRDAGYFGANCPQFAPPIIGSRQGFKQSEDCLFINVFTPNRRILRNLPVFFHIHLGGFHGESGDGNLNGWESFSQENAIYVTFNYRLDVLGHLNLQDRHSPGNYALKDIFEALKWVNSNIQYFGGDTNNIILMAPSVGGIVANLLILSEHATGLFHKAISLSGSLFHIWGTQPDPRQKAEALAERLGIQWTNSENLMAQLREVSYERLLNVTFTFLPTEMPTVFVPRTFVPSVDAEDSEEIKLFPAKPDVLIRNSTFNAVPLLVGVNPQESLSNIFFPQGRDRFNADPHLLIPYNWEIERNSPEEAEILDGFRRVYFNGSTVIEDMWQWVQFCNDRENIFAISKLVDFHYKKQPTFYYTFSYVGAFSLTQLRFGLMEYPGATMFDEQFYLHRINRQRNPVPRRDHAYTVQARFMRMIINFARTGNPTPRRETLLQNIQWPQVTDNLEYLDIGHDLKISTHPFKERMDLWRDFDRRFSKY